ncbi:GreA/GreB family elongation factor [Zunongwangia endophytica]|uniref:GreA/GreB family elongation factor n=1 Tax=Zunongwangia endophytica TaxID=1808945 RepID=A0ABV8HCL8_9FLAO|nr:GreA/GreB family elongation factor [Zunongwangia endophytica]MDN3594114.1 GreA/GreB family elongation factor [Zunongwangia endophytica]
MSRGFVKEEDQEEAPVIPPRAALPAGATNYVTPFGYEALEKEQHHLEKERTELPKDNETEKRRAQAVIDGKLKLLAERRASARIIYPNQQPEDEVRFGAKLKLKNHTNGSLQEFQIVGVDEANVKNQKIAFVAPIAKAVTGLKVGDKTDFKLGNETRTLEILEITY